MQFSADPSLTRISVEYGRDGIPCVVYHTNDGAIPSYQYQPKVGGSVWRKPDEAVKPPTTVPKAQGQGVKPSVSAPKEQKQTGDKQSPRPQAVVKSASEGKRDSSPPKAESKVDSPRPSEGPKVLKREKKQSKTVDATGINHAYSLKEWEDLSNEDRFVHYVQTSTASVAKGFNLRQSLFKRVAKYPQFQTGETLEIPPEGEDLEKWVVSLPAPINCRLLSSQQLGIGYGKPPPPPKEKKASKRRSSSQREKKKD